MFFHWSHWNFAPWSGWKTNPRILLSIAVLGAAAVAAGCASQTRLYDMWKDPGASPGLVRNALVVAVKKDAAARRIWEDGFVKRLGEQGVSATPSYRLFPDAVPDTAAVVEVVKDQGFDSVVVVHRSSAKTVQEVTPGYVSTQPKTYLDPWTGVFHTYYEEVYYPGEVEDVEVVVHQVDLWSTKDKGKLLWVGKAETYDP
ncbi:MAG TPA: hypothetical protein VFR10_09590, partial [bacterium]|nr:hypothetical protein [bacterium]